MRRLAPLAVLAGAFVAVGATATAERPDPVEPLFGVADDAALAAFPRSVDVLRASGFAYARVYVAWADVARRRPAAPRDPDDPAYDWSVPDRNLAPYAGTGLELMAAFWHVPAWANGGRPDHAWPAEPQDLADFAYAAARRYRQVRWWLVWNEPNNPTFADPATLEAYEPIARAVYAALHQARGDARVAVGSTTRNLGDPQRDAWRWARQLAADGVPMDAYAVHPYPAWRQPVGVRDPARRLDVWDLAELARVVRVPLLAMEFGWSTTRITPAQQAAWLAEAIGVARCTPGLARFTLWGFHDHPARDFWTRFGLLDADGAPKPALAAARTAITGPVDCAAVARSPGAPAGWPDTSVDR